jgi:hypothetical protein
VAGGDLVKLLAVTALFVLVLAWVTRNYLRRRDPLLREVMWMLAALLDRIRTILHPAGPRPNAFQGR